MSEPPKQDFVQKAYSAMASKGNMPPKILPLFKKLTETLVADNEDCNNGNKRNSFKIGREILRKAKNHPKDIIYRIMHGITHLIGLRDLQWAHEFAIKAIKENPSENSPVIAGGALMGFASLHELALSNKGMSHDRTREALFHFGKSLYSQTPEAKRNILMRDSLDALLKREMHDSTDICTRAFITAAAEGLLEAEIKPLGIPEALFSLMAEIPQKCLTVGARALLGTLGKSPNPVIFDFCVMSAEQLVISTQFPLDPDSPESQKALAQGIYLGFMDAG